MRKKSNFKKLLFNKKKELIRLYRIRIEYLELRNKLNLTSTNKIKNSKLFVAYYLNKIRLIDNY